MTDQPATVTAADITTVLLGQIPDLADDASPAEQLAWHEGRARLLNDIAAATDTPKAHLAAADAWHECSLLARRIHAGTEAGQ
jgi:hypothetical protein